MAFDFPTSPTIGQGYNNYTWDGEKWLLRVGGSYAKKNYIINGAMMVSQENGGTAGGNFYYPVDMFQYTGTGSIAVVSAAQVVSGTPSGSTNRIRLTVTTADATQDAGDAMFIQHTIEGYRMADLYVGSLQKPMTLQFGVRAPAGVYCVAFRGNSPMRSYVAEYTITAGEANTDVVKSVSLNMDGVPGYDYGNNTGLFITWALICGSTYRTTPNAWATGTFMGTANQVNFMGTFGNVFELFDVSLTEGTVAPPFMVPDYAQELQACRRYWRLSAGAQGASSNVTTRMFAEEVFDTPMRAAPTVTAPVLVSALIEPDIAFYDIADLTGTTSRANGCSLVIGSSPAFSGTFRPVNVRPGFLKYNARL